MLRKPVLTGLAVVIVLAGAGIGIARRAHKPKPLPAAFVAPPAAFDATEANLMGRVQARTTVPVSAPIEGTLEAYFVEVNQEVYRGQLVGRIRSANLAASGQQAQVDLDRAETRVITVSGDQLAAKLESSRAAADQARARAEFDRLEKVYQRQKGLWEAGATARLTFEKAQTDYADSKAAIEKIDSIAKMAAGREAAVAADLEAANQAVTGATAALERAKTDMAASEMHSPADGIITARRGQPGEPVDPSMKDLLQIATELTLLQVVVTPEAPALARIHAGQAATVQIPSISADEIPGKVREVRGTDVIVDFTSPTAITKLDVAAQVKIKF